MCEKKLAKEIWAILYDLEESGLICLSFQMVGQFCPTSAGWYGTTKKAIYLSCTSSVVSDMKEWAPLKFIFEWTIAILAESNLIFQCFTSGRAILPYPGWLVSHCQEPIYPWYIVCCLGLQMRPKMFMEALYYIQEILKTLVQCPKLSKYVIGHFCPTLAGC